MCLEFDRIGAGDTDLYCVALKDSVVSKQRNISRLTTHSQYRRESEFPPTEELHAFE